MGVGPQVITRTIMHHHPDVDEAYSYDLLRRHCPLLEGISNAPIEFSRGNSYRFNGKSIEELEAEDGFLFIGRHTALFNEHATEDKDRDEDECTASIVAQVLGTDRFPQEKQLLEHVVRADTKGDPHPMCLSRGLKHLNNAGVDPRTVLDWALLGFEAVRFTRADKPEIGERHIEKLAHRLQYKVRPAEDRVQYKDDAIKRILRQYRQSTNSVGIARMFYTLYERTLYRKAAVDWLMRVLVSAVENQIDFKYTVDKFKREGAVRTIKVAGRGRTFLKVTDEGRELLSPTYTVVVVESDEYFALQAARYLTDNAAVIVIKRSNGQTSIFGRKGYEDTDIGIMLRHNFDILARLIRSMEIAKKGKLSNSPRVTESEYMARESQVENAEEWYYFPKTLSLFNGSRTAPDVPATNISLDDIVKVVTLVLRQQALPEFWQKKSE